MSPLGWHEARLFDGLAAAAKGNRAALMANGLDHKSAILATAATTFFGVAWPQIGHAIVVVSVPEESFPSIFTDGGPNDSCGPKNEPDNCVTFTASNPNIPFDFNTVGTVSFEPFNGGPMATSRFQILNIKETYQTRLIKAACERLGFEVVQQKGSHVVLRR